VPVHDEVGVPEVSHLSMDVRDALPDRGSAAPTVVIPEPLRGLVISPLEHESAPSPGNPRPLLAALGLQSLAKMGSHVYLASLYERGLMVSNGREDPVLRVGLVERGIIVQKRGNVGLVGIADLGLSCVLLARLSSPPPRPSGPRDRRNRDIRRLVSFA
jgi:hypothetical protein